MSPDLEIIVLGSGGSTGVPIPGCSCKVCSSKDPKNNRLRPSVAVKVHLPQQPVTIIIDTGPDFRQQCLRANITDVNAVLYTHHHADHIFGIDDLRGFNFFHKKTIPVYAAGETAAELRARFQYIFAPDSNYVGGSPPKLQLNQIEPLKEFEVEGISILPLLLKHGPMDVIGFRIHNFAYLTDCSEIPNETAAQLHGLDILILDGLRERPHPTHFTFDQAAEVVNQLQPKKTFLTHLSHEVDYETGNSYLSSLSDKIELAWDGLTIYSDIPP